MKALSYFLFKMPEEHLFPTTEFLRQIIIYISHFLYNVFIIIVYKYYFLYIIAYEPFYCYNISKISFKNVTLGRGKIIMKNIKESLYLLSHPTSIGSWFFMWIFCAISIFLINMTIYRFDPVEDMMSTYIKSMVIFTISSIHVHRKLFINAFKNNPSDKDQHRSKDAKK